MLCSLVAFGIRRIATRQESPKEIRETAAQHGIEVVWFTHEENRRQMQRINRLVKSDRTDQELMEIAERNELKRQERKQAKKSSNKSTVSHSENKQ
jgi:hypothetical protein